MTLLAALAPNASGVSALHLAGMLARGGGEEIVVCTVVPASWPPGPQGVDAEYRRYVEATAREALQRAESVLDGELQATYRLHHARSVPAGLLEVARDVTASTLVLGPSSAGSFGHVVLGSVSDRLLHSSPVPVALATWGFRCGAAARVARVTVAFDASAGDDDVLLAAARLAARHGAPLRLASFAVRRPTMLSAGIGSRAEQDVLEQWREAVTQAQREAAVRVSGQGAPDVAGAVVGRGGSWEDAIADVDWKQDEMLVVGSSGLGMAARVFLGARATKIVRHAPVPVVVVPRTAGPTSGP